MWDSNVFIFIFAKENFMKNLDLHWYFWWLWHSMGSRDSHSHDHTFKHGNCFVETINSNSAEISKIIAIAFVLFSFNNISWRLMYAEFELFCFTGGRWTDLTGYIKIINPTLLSLFKRNTKRNSQKKEQQRNSHWV